MRNRVDCRVPISDSDLAAIKSYMSADGIVTIAIEGSAAPDIVMVLTNCFIDKSDCLVSFLYGLEDNRKVTTEFASFLIEHGGDMLVGVGAAYSFFGAVLGWLAAEGVIEVGACKK